MLIMLFSSLIPFMLTIMLILINKSLSFKSLQDREKPSPYECGFNPITSPHLPFSIQFYLIAVIFLIFDIEIILILPFIPTMISESELFYWMTSFLLVYICLMVGLIYEWNEQSIIWLK
uniref:NADH-ubiquinone oxidoreductase chain 3 n=1 Tax=Vespa ducalis TaxID=1075778 RepID=A0A343B786_VESDU|nr:NADH dehydrogenase subunit 3 [Vespa ducalis]